MTQSDPSRPVKVEVPPSTDYGTFTVVMHGAMFERFHGWLRANHFDLVHFPDEQSDAQNPTFMTVPDNHRMGLIDG